MQLFLYRSFPQPRHIFESSRIDSFSAEDFRNSSLFAIISNVPGLFAHFNLLCFFFSLYRSFFVFKSRLPWCVFEFSLRARVGLSREVFRNSFALAFSRNYFGPFPYFMPCLFLSLFLSSSFLLRFISLSALLSQTPLTWCSPYRCGNSRLDCV